MMEGTEGPQSIRKRNPVPRAATPEKPNPFRSRVLTAIKQADVFQKVESDHEIVTGAGGFLSLVSFIIIGFLFLGELRSFLTPETSEHISVDTSLINHMPVQFDLTFYSLRCSEVHIDVMDVSGDQQVDVFDSDGASLKRARLDRNGNRIGLPYEHKEIAAIKDNAGEGCHIFGFLRVNKVSGNLHIGIGKGAAKDGKHFHQFALRQISEFNASHRINRLHFGDREYPNHPNPMQGITEIIPEGWPGAMHFQYYVKVVPMLYTNTFGREIQSTTLSMTRNNFTIGTLDMVAQKIPGVFFFYEPSPYQVRVVSVRKPLSRFIMSSCAIIGGVLTIASIIDSLCYRFVSLFS
eukprot:gb/GEZN01009321.1/.p1 GENE.gb/GEZN01009321.1/~~gb/GEZN01009321.1/.p1  ORF type:complete len:377 (-),score=19.61 gb/GEZN01009321.1/:206-1255(-)